MKVLNDQHPFHIATERPKLTNEMRIHRRLTVSLVTEHTPTTEVIPDSEFPRPSWPSSIEILVRNYLIPIFLSSSFLSFPACKTPWLHERNGVFVKNKTTINL